MNSELCKATAEGNARKRAMKKYMERHKTMCVTLGVVEDADILAWLAKQKNRSAAIREILRKEAQA